MLGEHLDAASAGLRVGYEDASQFSREYKRLFGQPPGTREAGGRDVERLRAAVRSEAPGLPLKDRRSGAPLVTLACHEGRDRATGERKWSATAADLGVRRALAAPSIGGRVRQ